MPLRQLKHKVGSKLFDTKQDAVEYAAVNGGVPEKIIVEINVPVQAEQPEQTDPQPEPSHAADEGTDVSEKKKTKRSYTRRSK